jgi:WD40 repeat protein
MDVRQVTVLGGFQTTLLNNAEPIKLAIYIAPVIVFAVWINSLYLEAAQQRDTALIRESRFLADQSRRALMSGKPDKALAIVLEGVPLHTARPRTAEADIALTMALDQVLNSRLTLSTEPGPALSGINPDGRLVTVSWNSIHLWNSENGVPIGQSSRYDSQAIFRFGTIESWPALSDDPGIAIFNSDKTRVIICSKLKKQTQLWDMISGTLIGPLGEIGICDFSFSRDGGRIVSVWKNEAQLWNSATGAKIGEPMQHDDRVQIAKFSSDPSGERVVTVVGRLAKLWDGKTAAPVGKPMQHESDIHQVILSPDVPSSRILVIGGTRGRLWGSRTTKPIGRALQHSNPIKWAAFSPQGDKIVSVTRDDHTARLWNAVSGAPIGVSMRAPEMHYAEFSPDGTEIISYDGSGNRRIWVVSTGAEIKQIESEEIKPIGSDKDSASLITDFDSGRDHSSIRLLDDRIILSPVWPTVINDDDFSSPMFSPDGKIILTTSNGVVRLRDAQTGALIGEPMQHASSVSSVDFSRDGQRIVTASNMSIQQWDAGTGKLIGPVIMHDQKIATARFNFDATRIVSTPESGDVQQWDAMHGVPVGPPISDCVENGHSKIRDAIYTLDGKRIVMICFATARLRDSATGRQIGQDMKHDHFIDFRVFSPDGARLLIFATLKAQMWDAATGAPIGDLIEGEDVRFSYNGEYVLAVTSSGSIQIFNGKTGTADRPAISRIPKLNDHGASSDNRIVALTADNRILTYYDYGVELWDVPTGLKLGQSIPIRNFSRPTSIQVVPSPDGKQVLILSKTGWQVWNFQRPLPPMEQRVPVADLVSDKYLTEQERRELFLNDRTTEKMSTRRRTNQSDKIAELLDTQRVRNCFPHGSVSMAEWDACQEVLAPYYEDPRIMYQIGWLMMRYRQYDDALAEFTRAADAGYSMGFVGLGILYEQNRIPGFGPVQALDAYKKGGNQGALVIANFLLGNLYWSGKGVPKDRPRALTLWKEAAAQGNPYAAARLGELAESGAEPDVVRNLEYALTNWTLAADLFQSAGVLESDDTHYVLTRKATLARYFARQGDYHTLMRVWTKVRHPYRGSP